MTESMSTTYQPPKCPDPVSSDDRTVREEHVQIANTTTCVSWRERKATAGYIYLLLEPLLSTFKYSVRQNPLLAASILPKVNCTFGWTGQKPWVNPHQKAILNQC